MTKEEQMLIQHFNDLSERAYVQNRPCFTDFLDMNEQSLLLSRFSGPLSPVLYGGYELAERKIARFSETEVSFPVKWLRITPAHPKYSENLGHRDFLGSILGLGLERSCIGDLLVKDASSFVLCLNRVSDFIISELRMVRHTHVIVTEMEELEDVIQPEFEIIRGSVHSLRLDAVISLAFHLSRSQSCSLIESGQVFINNRLNVSNGTSLKDGDHISVRHKGKFIFIDSNSKSKKNKCIVEIHKYV